MIKNATRDDIPRIMEIRAGVRENRLRDPSRVTVDDVRWHIDNPGIFVWIENQRIVGFSAADPRNGSIFGLFVEGGCEGRGIGRALFERACDVLVEAGCSRMWLTTWPGTRAERFYRKAGWQVTGEDDGNLIFERPQIERQANEGLQLEKITALAPNVAAARTGNEAERAFVRMHALPNDILTPRLVLRLMEREVIDSCVAGDLQRAERLSDTKIPRELLDEPTALTYARTKLDADPQYRPWSIRAIILPATRTMVGHIRFHSCPDPDYLHPFARPAVEFGYHIFSEYRQRGYATEAARAVMDWARATFGIRHFIVCVAPDNRASLTVIAHLGFAKIGQHVDETDGIEHIYLCQREN